MTCGADCKNLCVRACDMPPHECGPNTVLTCRRQTHFRLHHVRRGLQVWMLLLGQTTGELANGCHQLGIGLSSVGSHSRTYRCVC